MGSSAIKKESSISLQYQCKDLELTLTAKYGIGGEERMEVDNESAEQPPHELHLRMNDTQESRFSDDVYQRIQDDVKGTMGFLEKFMTSPGVIVKTVRCISGKLLEKDIHGIHLVPENEELSITKVDEHGGTSAFSFKSDPASDITSVSECEQINNFVGVHPKKFWLTSVLWLLSELAVNKFGKGR